MLTRIDYIQEGICLYSDFLDNIEELCHIMMSPLLYAREDDINKRIQIVQNNLSTFRTLYFNFTEYNKELFKEEDKPNFKYDFYSILRDEFQSIIDKILTDQLQSKEYKIAKYKIKEDKVEYIDFDGNLTVNNGFRYEILPIEKDKQLLIIPGAKNGKLLYKRELYEYGYNEIAYDELDNLIPAGEYTLISDYNNKRNDYIGRHIKINIDPDIKTDMKICGGFLIDKKNTYYLVGSNIILEKIISLKNNLQYN